MKFYYNVFPEERQEEKKNLRWYKMWDCLCAGNPTLLHFKNRNSTRVRMNIEGFEHQICHPLG